MCRLILFRLWRGKGTASPDFGSGHEFADRRIHVVGDAAYIGLAGGVDSLTAGRGFRRESSSPQHRRKLPMKI
jgi:hypothetical protein